MGFCLVVLVFVSTVGSTQEKNIEVVSMVCVVGVGWSRACYYYGVPNLRAGFCKV